MRVDANDWSTQLRRGVLELCILSIIEQQPSYGYQIVSEMAHTRHLACSAGTLYPLLRRLKRDGLVDTSWEESGAGPPRQYYRLTPQGTDALRAMRQEWLGLVDAMHGHLRCDGVSHEQ